jgi:hypothetical protein
MSKVIILLWAIALVAIAAYPPWTVDATLQEIDHLLGV